MSAREEHVARFTPSYKNLCSYRVFVEGTYLYAAARAYARVARRPKRAARARGCAAPQDKWKSSFYRRRRRRRRFISRLIENAIPIRPLMSLARSENCISRYERRLRARERQREDEDPIASARASASQSPASV